MYSIQVAVKFGTAQGTSGIGCWNTGRNRASRRTKIQGSEDSLHSATQRTGVRRLKILALIEISCCGKKLAQLGP